MVNAVGFDRHRRRLVHGLRVLALLGATCGLLKLANDHHRIFDWTGNHRHSLSPASVAAVAAVAGPIAVSVYLPEQHAGRERAKALIARYQRLAARVELRFINPADVPDLMRKEEMREGEMVVSASGRQERVRGLSEAAVTDALARLARGEQAWLGFITGHGERSPTRAANFDLADFASGLAPRGIRAREISLIELRAVPDNISALVIASPQTDFLPAEISLIENFIARGGHLLWLLEPDLPPSLQALGTALGLQASTQTLIDPAAEAMGLKDPTLALVLRYEPHLALGQFAATALLPRAAPVIVKVPAGWTAATLFNSGQGSWGESGKVESQVAFDDGLDAPGPLPLAVALTRGQQRVVLVGDGDFLSNTYLGNGGNRELGIRLVEWLSANDALIKVDAVPAPDRELALAPWQIGVIGGGFLLGLPGAFLLNSLCLWWRRRA